MASLLVIEPYLRSWRICCFFYGWGGRGEWNARRFALSGVGCLGITDKSGQLFLFNKDRALKCI